MKYYARKKILSNKDLGKLAWEAIEPIWDDLPYSNNKKLSAFMELLTEGQRGLIALDWCQKIIRNDGLKDLFESSVGNLVPWAIQGFDMIGAKKYKHILSEAVKIVFKEEYPETAAKRKEAIRKLKKENKSKLEKLDDKFYKLIDSKDDNLETYRGTFVRNNADQFIKKSIFF